MSQTLYGIPWLRAQREIACCRCRRRKKKCDKRRPLCGECARSGAECVPLAPKKSAMTTLPAGYVHLLEEHIATLETRLRQSNPSIAGDHFLSDPRARPVNTPASMDLIADDAVPPLNMLSRLSDGPLDVAGPASPTDPPGAGPVATPDWVLGTFDEAIDFDLAALSGRDISPLTNPPRDRMTDQSQSEPTTFEADDIQDMEPGAPSLQLAIQEERLTESYLPLSVAGRYVKEYFTSAHPMWPFLHRQQWEDWWKYWSGPARQMNSPGSQTFFVDMVLSIGALLVHGSTPSSEHLDLSRASFQRAMAKYRSYEIQESSPILRTQSSLLLTVHAMHLDSVRDLFDCASESVKNCALSDLSYQRSRRKAPSTQQHGIDDVVQKMVTRTCLVIDIIISNTMEHSLCSENSLMDDDNMSELDGSVSSEELRLGNPFEFNSAAPSPADVALEEHIFQLRRIQYRILKITRRLEHDAQREGHPVPNLWRSWPRHDLDRWIHDIDSLSDSAERQRKFQSSAWLQKLANYTAISLFPNPYLAIRGGDSKHLVTAACSVLVSFRRFRVRDHTTCYTWTALLHQFQAGICVVFCLWATPTHQQMALYDRRPVCQALFACLATLIDFASKWSSAQVFRDVFELLMEAVPVVEFGDPSQSWSITPPQSANLQLFITELEDLKVQQKVINMLKTMRKGRVPFTSPSVEETQWIQYEHNEHMS
ncbi:Positive regulator of purine utilization [Colletotrichum fructicola]|nr:Positive regulator of purine utilization [Colletotrichum fructicola]KAF4922967.1 Positive regulator of purine utilization [Colletotrichum fructicola]